MNHLSPSLFQSITPMSDIPTCDLWRVMCDELKAATGCGVGKNEAMSDEKAASRANGRTTSTSYKGLYLGLWSTAPGGCRCGPPLRYAPGPRPAFAGRDHLRASRSVPATPGLSRGF